MGKKRRNHERGSGRNGSMDESRSNVGHTENSTHEEAHEEATPTGTTNASDAETEESVGAQAAPSEDMHEILAADTDSSGEGLEGDDTDRDLSDEDLDDLSLEDDEAGLGSEPEEFSKVKGEEGVGETLEGVSSMPPGVASAASQDPRGNTSESHGEDVDTEKLRQISPEFFEPGQRMSLDKVLELVDNTDRESDAPMKRTSRILSVQSVLDPELLTKLQARKDRKTHIGTVRKWKHAGDQSIELDGEGVNHEGLGTWPLFAISRAPSKEVRIRIAKEAIENDLSVRDIDKMVSPLARRAKMEAKGLLKDMGERAIMIFEGLDDPKTLMGDVDISPLLQDPDRLRTELSFSELSTIHEKAKQAEKKTEKQKEALEEKVAKYLPTISFLRLIRKCISQAFEGEDN